MPGPAFVELVRRDLRLAWRAGGGAALSLAFFAVVVALFPLGLDPAPERLREIAPAVVWIAALLAVLLSLDRLFAEDFEDGSLDGLALSPLPLPLVVATRAFAHWLGVVVPLLIFAPVAGLMLALDPRAVGWLALSLAVGTPALSLVGAIGAALTVAMRRAGSLIALLVLPLEVPVLIFGVLAVRALDGPMDPVADLLLLGGFSLAALALAPFAAAAALRLALE